MMTLLYRASLAGALAVLALAAPARGQTAPDTAAQEATPDHPTAYKALHVMAGSLGRDALDRVVEVTGRDGAPQPRLWKVVLKEDAGSREVDVEDGKITSQRPLSRPPAYPTPIKLSDLNLDSSGAFDATDAQARKVKLRFDSLNYDLHTSDASGKPVWHIELISKEGTGVGAIRVAAHDGTVIAKEGRLASNYTPTPIPVSTPRSTPRSPASTPALRVVSSTPRPVSTPRHVTTTTTTTTYERTNVPAAQEPTVVTERDNVYAPQPTPLPDEEGGLFMRAGRTIDHTNQRVTDTLRHTGERVQRFFSFHNEGEEDTRPTPQVPGNRPD